MQAVFNQSKHTANLPDAYKKTPDSNNAKILEIERYSGEELREILRGIENILDINQATGKTLDKYGERVGQARGLADDAKYLLLIKAKTVRNLSTGSYPSVMEALCQAFGCDPSEILIENDDAPSSVKIVLLPLTVINKAGLTSSQATAIIKSLLPIGTTITSLLFEGTFQFSDSETEYDETAGFCDVEGGTIGGYLGVTSGDEQDVILPI